MSVKRAITTKRESVNTYTSMKGFIYLVGGGEIRNGETREIDNEVQGLVDERSTLVFFGRASGDSANYRKAIESVFGDKLNVIAPTIDDGIAFSRSAIESASIIYLGGGDTDLLMDFFDKGGLVEDLKSALQRGVHVVGMSAGALAMAAWYVHEHNELMELRRGWGLVPACVLVHAHEESVPRAVELWRGSRDARVDPFIAIGERAGWRLDAAGGRSVGDGKIWNVDGEAN